MGNWKSEDIPSLPDEDYIERYAESFGITQRPLKTPGELEDDYRTETFGELPDATRPAPLSKKQIEDILDNLDLHNPHGAVVLPKMNHTHLPLEGFPMEATNPKKARGAAKAPMGYCPATALIELEAVMGGGGHKYGPYNFRESPIDCMTYIGAIKRHFMLWEDGVDTDEESGRHHLAHIMACCALALDAHHTGQLVDNRSKTGLVARLLKDCAVTHNEFTNNNRAHDETQEEFEARSENS